ncbi:MAG: MglA protein [Myxococcales bacterium]
MRLRFLGHFGIFRSDSGEFLQLDFAARELTIKLVYYGPALSGKTTNLQALHQLVSHTGRGRLMTLDTRDDRTLFFDLLPLSFTAGSGLTVRLKLFTVPGQVIHNATRRLVLSGADGVAFIADSQRSETKANAAAFVNLKQNLKENGLDSAKIPLLIQFNKRDLPDIRPDDEIDQLAQRGKEPVFKAVATRGVGVAETFLGLVRGTWELLEREHQLKAKFHLDPEEVLATLVDKLGLKASKLDEVVR